MKVSDMKIVYKCITKFGDGFWNEKPKNGTTTNKCLCIEILEYINKAGYDLQLIKLENK